MVIISSGDRDKAMTGLIWASRMKEKGLVGDLKVYFFGPVERLLANGDEDLLGMVKDLEEKGVEVLACHGVAERGGYEEELVKSLGEARVTHVGRLIAQRISEGYTPLVF